MTSDNPTTTRHTPGPWTVIRDDTGGEFTGWPSVQAPEHIDTAVVHRAGFKQTYWGDLSQRECIANAYLIAAAPDLLAAAIKAMDECCDLVATDAGNALSSAIARAFGKSA